METWPGGHIYENCLTNFEISDVWVQLWYQHDKWDQSDQWDQHKNNMAENRKLIVMAQKIKMLNCWARPMYLTRIKKKNNIKWAELLGSAHIDT